MYKGIYLKPQQVHKNNFFWLNFQPKLSGVKQKLR